MSKASPAADRCPLCDGPIDPAIACLPRRLDAPIVRVLRADHPHWNPDDGACPECVFRAALQARSESRPYSLPEEASLPFSADSCDEARILPVPDRVQANPRLAGRGVTIAFLDSGFYPHPDLVRPTNRIVCHVDATTAEFRETARFKRPRGASWHGTMVACVGAGSGFQSDRRYRGIAHQARLALVKTGNPRSGPRLRITERDIRRALNWVIANHKRFDIRVVNISVGGDHPSTGQSTSLDAKVEEAVRLGLVVVAAVGNGDTRRVMPPASSKSAITVGGLDDRNSLERRLRRMYGSNYGRGVDDVPKPELIAPASWLAAPILPGTWVHNEAQYLWRLLHAPDVELRRSLGSDYAQARFSKRTLGLPLEDIRLAIRRRLVEQKVIHPHYQHVDGTSMAASIVSSVVAQMLEADLSLTPEQVKQHLTATADALPDVPPERQGAGVIHAGRAVASVLRAARSTATTLPFGPQRTVTFNYFDPTARRVALAGSFNDWRPADMRERAPGAWILSLPHPRRGSYAYKFILDGERWVDDPENSARIEDGSGGFYSLLAIE